LPLLNYTTAIDPQRTMAEIQRCLVRHGARGVMTEFDPQGRPAAMSFIIPTAFGDRSFRLPANVVAVERTLAAQAKAGNGRVKATPEHAARVAWRIVKDWVEAQMAIVESGMVALPEVFLPYMLVAGGRTMYEVAQERRLGLPAPDHG
jgi:hypothetical protein